MSRGCEAYCTAAKLELHRIDGCPSLANSSIRKADIAAIARARREEAARAGENGGLGPRGAPPTPPARPALRRSQRAPQARVRAREVEAEEEEAAEVEVEEEEEVEEDYFNEQVPFRDIRVRDAPVADVPDSYAFLFRELAGQMLREIARSLREGNPESAAAATKALFDLPAATTDHTGKPLEGLDGGHTLGKILRSVLVSESIRAAADASRNRGS